MIEEKERKEARPARSRRPLGQETATKAGFWSGFLTQRYLAALGGQDLAGLGMLPGNPLRLCASALRTREADVVCLQRWLMSPQSGCHLRLSA